MILAAGRGERMRPLTDKCPKPLLTVKGRPLIEYHVRALVSAGIVDIVINHAYLGEQIVAYLGDGERYGANIEYSAEVEALETAGGIIQALPKLGSGPFAIVNGDVWSDYSFSQLPPIIDGVAHLVMISNPVHNPNGDFYFDNGKLHEARGTKLTYSGIALLTPELFESCMPSALPLAPLLREAIVAGSVSAEHFQGEWVDVGTPGRLAALDESYTHND